MKKEHNPYLSFNFLLALLIISISLPVAAQEQDVMYLVDETPVKGTITEISQKRVKYTNESGQIRSFKAEELTMVFNKSGNFLIFPFLELTSGSANDFVSSASKPTLDLLITLDKKLIPATIISANENEVMYQDADAQKTERSIGKDILAVIIFKNGQHELLVSPSQASEILFALKGPIKQLYGQPQPIAENAPASKPGNELSKMQDTTASVSTPAAASTQHKTEVLVKPENVNPETEAANKRKEAALKKVNDLTTYIHILSSPSTDKEKAKKTIDMACALFVDEEARVEVSNLRTGAKNKYKIKDYLNRLSMRPGQFDKIEVQYANVNYASDFKQKADGSYQAQISSMQTVKGINSGAITYGNMIPRKAFITQKSPGKADASAGRLLWDVFLSDIGIIEAEKSN